VLCGIFTGSGSSYGAALRRSRRSITDGDAALSR
jgi:hypothetical protein